MDGLCRCLETKSTHGVETIGSWDGCPLEGGGHTSFIVQRCTDCGKISFSPDRNGEIALEKGTEAAKEKLYEILSENEQDRLTIKALMREGHSYHCACRQVWGDGECECDLYEKGYDPYGWLKRLGERFGLCGLWGWS